MEWNHVEKVIERCNISVKNKSHKRCIELFNPFMSRFTENPNTIRSVFQNIMGVELTSDFRETACFNGRYDNDILGEPFKVHLYIQYDDLRINLYYIENENDLNDALFYDEQDEKEYKALVVHPKMKGLISKEVQEKALIIDENEIQKLSDVREVPNSNII